MGFGWLNVRDRGIMLLGKALRDVWARRNSCSLGLLRELRRSYGCNAIGSHESRRARCYEGKGECEGGSPGEVHGVHVFQCAVSHQFASQILVPSPSDLPYSFEITLILAR